MDTSIRLNPLDTAWLFTESRATPNHVGGLLTFKVPEDAPKDYLRRMMAEFREHRQFVAPWNRRLKFAFTKNPVPAWVETDDIDLEYHVRHAALPWPGGERELGELVGRLHSTPIDLTRPPWECTIIEGLSDNRFGLFIKMHHSLIDGVSGVRTLFRAFTEEARASEELPPFWAAGAASSGLAGSRKKTRREKPTPTVAQATEAALEALSVQARSLPQLALAFGRIIQRIGDPHAGLAVPFDAPRSVLNGRVREKRRFATQQFEIKRMKAVAVEVGGTLNDVVLALCGGAMRRFLLERGELPEKALTAGIPVSVRPADSTDTGNAISFIVCTLGTDIEDPVERMSAIRASVKAAKGHVQSLPRQAMMQYTMLLMAPTILTLLTGIGGRTPPMFNCTISNVPGPEKPLYFRGAEVLAAYPASIVQHGQALNITCASYNGQMNFGLTACHSSVPSVQRLAVYLADEMRLLEAALGLGAGQEVDTARAKRPRPAAAGAARPVAPRKTARTGQARTKR